MAPTAALFEVVGGAAKGGLVVRKENAPGAEECQGRLATGAVVLELEHDAESERMYYQLVEGSGPENGWVNMCFKGKALLVPTEDETSTEDAESLMEGASTEQEEEEATEFGMDIYCARLMEERVPEDMEESQCEKESPQLDTSNQEHVEAEVRAALAVTEVESAELITLCQTKQKQKAEAAKEKASVREEHEIGWQASVHPPLNLALEGKLSTPVPQGMCCLVFDKDTRSVSIAPTLEPAAAVNLEYLSTVLEVRRGDGQEPRFSLDPADAGNEFFDPKFTTLVKRFEPAWLAGTSVGEVLFQSDYHLKELSMGEHEQPVVGMKSCADFSLGEGDEWNAREWYVVRQAEVRMSGDNVLMPSVKMGIEAREQISGPNGLEDVPTTKPTHPMVRYAESFTQNFDLIAERKSVVYHLRELAKASVLAKFLLESEAELDDTWFNSTATEPEACNLEIPQLWHRGCGKTDVSLYGGVQFGLDKFTVSGARQPARMLSAGLAARQFVQPARHLSATLSAGLATRQFQRSFGPLGVQPARVAGVDLNLDDFNLSAPAEEEDFFVRMDAGVDIAAAFWSNLEGDFSKFCDEDRKLFNKVFNPCLSDRREEGSCFVPPDTSASYLERLRNLVKEEDTQQQRRREHFLSKTFQSNEPGPLFPSAWATVQEVTSKNLEARPDFKSQEGLFVQALAVAEPIFDEKAEDGTSYRIYRTGSLEVRTVQEHEDHEVVGAVFAIQA